MKRNLSLRRETLSDLSADDLAGVAAGAPLEYSGQGITCPLTHCVSQQISCGSCVSFPTVC